MLGGLREIIAMPRSWPSWPSLATSMRGHLPFLARKRFDLPLYPAEALVAVGSFIRLAEELSSMPAEQPLFRSPSKREENEDEDHNEQQQCQG
jgi:hypothetical protein